MEMLGTYKQQKQKNSPFILVLQVVRMLPHVNHQNRLQSKCDRTHLIFRGINSEIPLRRLTAQPNVPRSKQCHGFFAHP